MARRIEAGDDAAWAALFDSFAASAFRWEAQQYYDSPEEAAALARFQAGLDPGLDMSWEVETTRAYRTQGKRLARVRLVLEPATDYVRMALHYLPVLADAGEDIRVISRPAGTWPAGLPAHDFWIFDQRDVWVMHYDETGAFTCAELVDDDDLTAAHLGWQRNAVESAHPLAQYVAALRRKAS